MLRIAQTCRLLYFQQVLFRMETMQQVQRTLTGPLEVEADL